MSNNDKNAIIGFTMRTIIATLIYIMAIQTVFGQGCYLPKNDWKGFSVYVPQHTQHFNKSKRYDVNGVFNSQGGNKGLAVTYSTTKTHYSFGYISNSYGDWSKFATIGTTLYQNRNNQLTLNLGMADNYQGSYSQKVNKELFDKIFPKFMVKNQMVAVVMATYKRNIATVMGAKVGVQVNVSPIYVNTGLFVKL